ncbi:hypothetical protein SO694_000442106 [Aureococcus anophagefferens]|uniref:Uncharacterized protein n=1 Tax=Aureococcus anophagefferens TaxID=44056 RepID=A0ABR1G7I0_AURAN
MAVAAGDAAEPRPETPVGSDPPTPYLFSGREERLKGLKENLTDIDTGSYAVPDPAPGVRWNGSDAGPLKAALLACGGGRLEGTFAPRERPQPDEQAIAAMASKASAPPERPRRATSKKGSMLFQKLAADSDSDSEPVSPSAMPTPPSPQAWLPDPVPKAAAAA